MRYTSERERRRFTGRQLTTIVVATAVAVAVIAFPVGVFAATGTLVNITDPVTTSHKARVNATGRLLTSVDGTVGSRAVPPTSPFRFAKQHTNPQDQVLGPTTRTINVTSLTVTAANAGTSFEISVLRLPGTATDCNATIKSVDHLYIADGLAVGVPLTASFPTPLQSRPPTGTKLCMEVFGAPSDIDISGFLS